MIPLSLPVPLFVLIPGLFSLSLFPVFVVVFVNSFSSCAFVIIPGGGGSVEKKKILPLSSCAFVVLPVGFKNPLSVIMLVFSSSFFFSLFLCLCHHTWVCFFSLCVFMFLCLSYLIVSLSPSCFLFAFVVIPVFCCCFLSLSLCLSVPSLVVWQRDCTPVCATRLALP